MRLDKAKKGRLIDRTGDSDMQKFGRRVKRAWNDTLEDFGIHRRQSRTQGPKDIWKKKTK